jgi:hypothetical protein
VAGAGNAISLDRPGSTAPASWEYHGPWSRMEERRAWWAGSSSPAHHPEYGKKKEKGRGVIPGLAPDWSRAGLTTQLEGNQSEDSARMNAHKPSVKASFP